LYNEEDELFLLMKSVYPAKSSPIPYSSQTDNSNDDKPNQTKTDQSGAILVEGLMDGLALSKLGSSLHPQRKDLQDTL
jgi:hypothetical protein